MIREHFRYIADRRRLEQFRAALAAVIKPGDRVADVGCGSGILGLLALEAGAGHVTAIDDSAMLEIAKQSFVRAGHGERADFRRGRASQLEIAAPVDLVVCDHVGYFGFDYGILDLLDDARRRFLAPGGKLMPRRLRLSLAAISSESCEELALGWQRESIPAAFHWVSTIAVNKKHGVDLQAEEVISSPAVLGELDLYASPPDFVSWNVELRFERDAIMHGIAGWFDCELAADVWMTNSPVAESPINRPQAFFSIGEPVSVRAGEVVNATMMARPREHVLAWNVEFPASGLKRSHSTWESLLLAPEDLPRANPAHVPSLNRRALARQIVLGYCDGVRTIKEIEEIVLRDHPDLMPSPREISRFVNEVVGRL